MNMHISIFNNSLKKNFKLSCSVKINLLFENTINSLVLVRTQKPIYYNSTNITIFQREL